MKPKYALLFIVVFVNFFTLIAAVLLFTDVVVSPYKYFYFGVLAPLSWLAIKWLPVKKE